MRSPQRPDSVRVTRELTTHEERATYLGQAT